MNGDAVQADSSRYSRPAWFHVVLTAYGAWLYGDARGYRTRHHREHIKGDYKNPPPPGTHSLREQFSRSSLKQPPVAWPPQWRAIIGNALVERFIELGAFVLCLAASRQHVHVLVKMPRQHARCWCGLAKKHAWFIARRAGWQGKLFAKRGRQAPVRDRRHQLNTYRYILSHAKEGAWIWDWRRDANR